MSKWIKYFALLSVLPVFALLTLPGCDNDTEPQSHDTSEYHNTQDEDVHRSQRSRADEEYNYARAREDERQQRQAAQAKQSSSTNEKPIEASHKKDGSM